MSESFSKGFLLLFRAGGFGIDEAFPAGSEEGALFVELCVGLSDGGGGEGSVANRRRGSKLSLSVPILFKINCIYNYIISCLYLAHRNGRCVE